MSAKTETEKKLPEKPAPKPKPNPRPQKEGSGSSGAFLAMAIALGAAGGSYYVWQQHLVAEQDRRALQQSIVDLLKVVEQKDQAQLARIEQLRDHRHQQNERRIEALEQTLPALRAQLSVQQQQWTLAEVDYLIRIAEYRLQLNRDIPTAITALNQASEQLQTRTNGEFATVISEIDLKIASLTQITQDSTTEIGTRLAQLGARIGNLPFTLKAMGEEIEADAPAPLTEEVKLADKAKHWAAVVWHDIKSLVTIRRSDEVSAPVLEPQQHQLIESSLRIKLESARLAALAHNQLLYTTMLNEAADLLQRYYDTEAPATIDSFATLQQLAALEVAPELPSLSELRQQLHAIQPVTPAVPVPEESIPLQELPAEPSPEELPQLSPVEEPALQQPSPQESTIEPPAQESPQPLQQELPQQGELL